MQSPCICSRSLSGFLGSLRDEAQLATEAVNRVETQVTNIHTLSVQQEYFNALASGLFGLHYSSGVEEDGSTIRYAHTSENLADSAYAWKSGIRGFFISTDGGETWEHGWDTTDHVVKTAVEAVGVNANILGSGTLRTTLVKILGTEDFYWEGDAIVIKQGTKLIKIGRYKTGKYGIATSSDDGTTWTVAVDFDGVHGGGSTIIQQDLITKSSTAPVSPKRNDLWVDTANNRLKLWNGTAWEIVGYEPEETPTEPTDPETPPETPTDSEPSTNPETPPDEGGDDTGDDTGGETGGESDTDTGDSGSTEEGGA